MMDLKIFEQMNSYNWCFSLFIRLTLYHTTKNLDSNEHLVTNTDLLVLLEMAEN